MKIKIHEFKLVAQRLGDSGGGDEEKTYMVSKAVLTIPEQLLNQRAVVETLFDGVAGVNGCCSRIYIDGHHWLVLGDVRALCYTNDVIETHY